MHQSAVSEWSTVVDFSIPPPSFKHVSLSSPRSPLSKTPKQVIFNPINIFDTFTTLFYYYQFYFFRLTSTFIFTGGPAGAKAGTVTTMVGTKESTSSVLLTQVLQAVAGRIVYLDAVGAGNAVKAINNMMNVSHLVFASECMYGLKLAGVNVGSALDAINHSSGRSLQTEVRLPTEVLTGQ